MKRMKKILTLAVLLMTSIALFAQEKKDVTKFLGIPVDGYKSEMISKLKAKGFTSTSRDKNILEGEFNGYDVYVSVITNNRKVWRIGLADKKRIGETGIRIRFNNLCRQFMNNDKYYALSDDQTIPDDEDISYNMTVKNKRYEAYFYQNGDYNKPVWFMIHGYDDQYCIIMFYDNKFNEANGEDL